MIVRTLENLIGTARDVDWGNGNSRRFLIEQDNMNFSLTDTICKAGSRSQLEYKNHLEACYCIAGAGEIHDTETGEVYPISPGTLYALDKHDKHYLVANEELRLVCVFQPALRGDESHKLREDGSSSY
ncbi:MAG: ectoine synthase [Methylococcales bacterium]